MIYYNKIVVPDVPLFYFISKLKSFYFYGKYFELTN